MKTQRSNLEPIRKNTTWNERWCGADQGLIACWERGREKRMEDQALVAHAEAGWLVILPWKGGVDKKIKNQKYGTLFYIAMWQGLRGECLNIDSTADTTLTCAATNATVFFNKNAKNQSA